MLVAGAVVVVFVYLSIYLSPASLKAKLFRKASSIFEGGGMKNEAIRRDILNF